MTLERQISSGPDVFELVDEKETTASEYNIQLRQIGTYRLTATNINSDDIESEDAVDISTINWDGLVQTVPAITNPELQVNGNVLSVFADAITVGSATAMEIRFRRVAPQLAAPAAIATEEEWDNVLTNSQFGVNTTQGVLGVVPISVNANGTYAQFVITQGGNYTFSGRYLNAIAQEGPINSAMGSFLTNFDLDTTLEEASEEAQQAVADALAQAEAAEQSAQEAADSAQEAADEVAKSVAETLKANNAVVDAREAANDA